MALFVIQGSSWAGPISEYYMTWGDNDLAVVVQGNSVVRSWIMSSYGQSPIAVLNGFVRTDGYTSGTHGDEYTTLGVPTGNSYAHPAAILAFYDGTTDGHFNYGVDWGNGGVYRMNLDWSNAVQLFPTVTQSLGITYDPTNDSLWVSDWTDNTIRDYTMSGTVLSSFTSAVGKMTGLALDHADNTLWFGTQVDISSTTRTLYQYSKSGGLLSTAGYAGLTNVNYLGGEFAFVPEPGAFVVATAALFALVAVAWRKRRN